MNFFFEKVQFKMKYSIDFYSVCFENLKLNKICQADKDPDLRPACLNQDLIWGLNLDLGVKTGDNDVLLKKLKRFSSGLFALNKNSEQL